VGHGCPFPCTRENLFLYKKTKQGKITLSWCRLTVVQGASITLCRADVLVTYPLAMTLYIFREIPVGIYMNSDREKSQAIKIIIQQQYRNFT
jgi:hypothetical protein